MPVATQPRPSARPTPAIEPYRFSVEEYHRMGELGILTPDHRVELLEGVVVEKMNLNPPHMLSMGLINAELTKLLSTDWHVRLQGPITTAESEPEPDLAVVRGTLRDYGTRHPTPAETALVVEVAESSLNRDRGPKAILYARARIATYWLVNLVDRQVEVYTDPSGPADEPKYETSKTCKPGGDVPVVLDGAEVAKLKVADLLP